MNPLDHIMSTTEAAELWGLSPDHVKKLCRDGVVKSKLIGKTYVIDKNQPNPRKDEFIMKTMIIEKRKNASHIIGEEFEESYTARTKKDVKIYMDHIIDSLDGETYDNHEEEIKAIYDLENGLHIIEDGDFNYYVEIKDAE